MKVHTLILLLLSFIPLFSTVGEELFLHYDQPASQWTDALPIGNGRLGAMVFGGVAEARLQLNESTLWSGGPTDWNNPSAREVLPEIRAATLAGDYAKATELYCKMQGPYMQSYQPLGDLEIRFHRVSDISDYRRSLDLKHAVATTQYRMGNAMFTREVFSSFPDQVIVMRITCDQPEQISFDISASSLQRYSVKAEAYDTLILKGQVPSHVDPSYVDAEEPILYNEQGGGMKFDLRVKVIAEGGRVYQAGSCLTVERANAVTILLSAATSFDGPHRPLGRDPSVKASEHLAEASQIAYNELLTRHLEDYQQLFQRV
jgi:alpha-L-fucosidase 2